MARVPGCCPYFRAARIFHPLRRKAPALRRAESSRAASGVPVAVGGTRAAKMPPMGDTKRAILPSDVPRSDETNEFTPSLALAKARALDRLPRDPSTGQQFGKGTIPRPSDFEFLGLSVYSYVSHLRRTRQFFVLIALLSVSSIIANGYGGRLDEAQISVVTWLFTGSSLGNASSIAPSYGANEFVISTAMTIFLYFALGSFEEDAHRVEQKQITPADFSVGEIWGDIREIYGRYTGDHARRLLGEDHGARPDPYLFT